MRNSFSSGWDCFIEAMCASPPARRVPAINICARSVHVYFDSLKQTSNSYT